MLLRYGASRIIKSDARIPNVKTANSRLKRNTPRGLVDQVTQPEPLHRQVELLVLRRHLTQSERFQVHALHYAGHSIRTIGEHPGRAASMICRGLDRNVGAAGYVLTAHTCVFWSR